MASGIDGRDFGSWLAVWNELSRQNATVYPNGDPQPTDDAAVRAAYSVDSCSTLCVGFAAGDRNLHAFLALADGSVRVFRDVYPQSGGRCEGGANVERRGQVVDITTASWTVAMNCQGDSCQTSCEGPGEWRSASLLLEPNERTKALACRSACGHRSREARSARRRGSSGGSRRRAGLRPDRHVPIHSKRTRCDNHPLTQ